VAVDLGAESCRVSLLRWADGKPRVELVHRLPNGPVRGEDGSLRWPLEGIVAGVEDGLRMCAERAPEGIASIGVDGWAVDYARVDERGEPLDAPFCYRDARKEAAAEWLHARIPEARLQEVTGIQPQTLNTVYQLCADRLAGLPSGARWLNLPEYLLARWGGEPVSEYTMATHTEMLELGTRAWSEEVLQAAEIEAATMPRVVTPGTVLGKMRGPLAELAAFSDTALIAPVCHDTASAVAGIPAEGQAWGYVSCGTWSLAGTPMRVPHNRREVQACGFTNLGSATGEILLQKNLNGLWILQQCMNEWGGAWEIAALCVAAEKVEAPRGLIDVQDAELQKVGAMPARINAQRRARGMAEMDESAAGAPAMAALIFRSLAACYAATFERLEQMTGKRLETIYVVGGGSRNEFLLRLTAEATGKRVVAGAAESSTVGNFAVQIAAVEGGTVGEYARLLAGV
jgi:rhamnulokinase